MTRYNVSDIDPRIGSLCLCRRDDDECDTHGQQLSRGIYCKSMLRCQSSLQASLMDVAQSC